MRTPVCHAHSTVVLPYPNTDWMLSTTMSHCYVPALSSLVAPNTRAWIWSVLITYAPLDLCRWSLCTACPIFSTIGMDSSIGKESIYTGLLYLGGSPACRVPPALMSLVIIWRGWGTGGDWLCYFTISPYDDTSPLSGGSRMLACNLLPFLPPLIASGGPNPKSPIICYLNWGCVIGTCPAHVWRRLWFQWLARSPHISRNCGGTLLPEHYVPPSQGTRKELPHRMDFWEGGVLSKCTSQGSNGDQSGLLYGGIPGPSSCLSCAWGSGRKHFGTDRSLFQGISPSGTSDPGRDRAWSTFCHLLSIFDDKEGIELPCTQNPPST